MKTTINNLDAVLYHEIAKLSILNSEQVIQIIEGVCTELKKDFNQIKKEKEEYRSLLKEIKKDYDHEWAQNEHPGDKKWRLEMLGKILEAIK
jgi:predicted RNase H-like nuclease (RuvC/YqgF family)